MPDLLSRNNVENESNDEMVCVIEDATETLDTEALKDEIKKVSIWCKKCRIFIRARRQAAQKMRP